MKNNFDSSSTGVNIELAVCYDRDMASHYYRDWIDGADGNAVYTLYSARNQDPVGYLVGNADEPYFADSKLNTMNPMERGALCDRLDCDAEDLAEMTIKTYYERILHTEGYQSFKAAITHPYFSSHGYSQGDIMFVIDAGADYAVTAMRRKEAIDHILWDAPVFVQVWIDEEPQVDDQTELFGDEYSYNKEKLMTYLSEKLEADDVVSGTHMLWIDENLPSEPSYS